MSDDDQGALQRAIDFHDDVLVGFYDELHRQWADGHAPAPVMKRLVFVLEAQMEWHSREVRRLAGKEMDRADEMQRRGEQYDPSTAYPMLILDRLGATWRALPTAAAMNKRGKFIPTRIKEEAGAIQPPPA